MSKPDKYEEALRVLVVMRDKSKDYAARSDVPIVYAEDALERSNALTVAIEALREKQQREKDRSAT